MLGVTFYLRIPVIKTMNLEWGNGQGRNAPHGVTVLIGRPYPRRVGQYPLSMQLSRTLFLSLLLPFTVHGAELLAAQAQEQAIQNGLVMHPSTLDQINPQSVPSKLISLKVGQLLGQTLSSIQDISAVSPVMQSLKGDIEKVCQMNDLFETNVGNVKTLSLKMTFDRLIALLQAKLKGVQTYDSVIATMSLFVIPTRDLSTLFDHQEPQSSKFYQRAFNEALTRMNHLLNAELGQSKDIRAVSAISQKFESMVRELNKVAKEVNVDIFSA